LKKFLDTLSIAQRVSGILKVAVKRPPNEGEAVVTVFWNSGGWLNATLFLCHAKHVRSKNYDEKMNAFDLLIYREYFPVFLKIIPELDNLKQFLLFDLTL